MAIPDQAPNSTVEGYLQGSLPGDRPGQIFPSQPLENFLQQLVAGVAGIEETLVRPRWQPQPPNFPIPKLDTDWCATGIIRRHNIGYAGIVHRGADDGHDEMQRHEEFELLVTMYGPLCDAYISNLHDGMEIWQNRSRLRKVGLAYVGPSDTTRVPELIRNEWVDRCDKTLTFRRIIVRDYPVLNLLEAPFTVNTDSHRRYSVSMTTPRP